jgi:ribonuclease HIII
LNTLKEKAYDLINGYSRRLTKQGLIISSPKENQFNFESDVTSQKERIKLLVYFGQKGIKTVLQGNKETKLYRELYKIINGDNLFPQEDNELIEPAEYIGTDESGKGDYFGPLVIAGVYVDSQSAKGLREAGVKDSKLLDQLSIKKISAEIKRIIKDNYNIISISPGKYNDLHKKMGNVNRILGWAHAKVLENILEKKNIQTAISDKFGDESLIINSLQTKGKKIILHQETKAERFIAVAAASILARNIFADWFELQSRKIKMNIPKGASLKVELAAAAIKKLHGEAMLNQLVKLHFKTTHKLLDK